jgi:DNA-binding PadR family transcriptional regulator
MFGRHFHDFAGRARLFEKGDLKYVILDLLKDKPAHGYEIIRALEDRFHGFYTPSAGSVYPTLQLLEDMGYVKAAEQDGKKVYTITDEGKKFLEERGETIDKIKEHIRGWWGYEHRDEFRDLIREFHDLFRTLGRRAPQMDSEQLKKIKEIIYKARHDIEDVVNK